MPESDPCGHCQPEENPSSARFPTMLDALKAHGGFTTLLSALEAADMLSKLTQPGSTTIYAPTDAAWQRSATARLGRLTDASLSALLSGHTSLGDLDHAPRAGARATVLPRGARVRWGRELVADNGRVKVIEPDPAGEAFASGRRDGAELAGRLGPGTAGGSGRADSK